MLENNNLFTYVDKVKMKLSQNPQTANGRKMTVKCNGEKVFLTPLLFKKKP